jgi:DNA polymerase III epsilon subunit-like protein
MTGNRIISMSTHKKDKIWWPFTTAKIVVVDLETSGPHGRIIQFGYMRLDGIPHSFVLDPGFGLWWHQHPYHLLHPREGSAYKHPRITQEEYNDMSVFEKKAQFIYDLLDGAFVVFHGKGNDVNTIQREFDYMNSERTEYNKTHTFEPKPIIPCPKYREVICTLNLLSQAGFEFKKDLSNVCDVFNIPRPSIPHNAAYDAEAAFRVMVGIANRYDSVRRAILCHIFPDSKTPRANIRGEEWIDNARFTTLTSKPLKTKQLKEMDRKRKAQEEERSLEDEGQFPEHVVLPYIESTPFIGDDDNDSEPIDHPSLQEDDYVVVISEEKPKKSNNKCSNLLIEFHGYLTKSNAETMAAFQVTAKTIEYPWGVIAYNTKTHHGIVFLHGENLYPKDVTRLIAKIKAYLEWYSLSFIGFRKTFCMTHGTSLRDCEMCVGGLCKHSNAPISKRRWATTFAEESQRIQASHLWLIGNHPSDQPWKGLFGYREASTSAKIESIPPVW